MERVTFSRIAGTGSYLPPRVMTNDDFAKHLDTSDAWIRERTGIASRHIADEKQTSSDLAFEASKRALEAAGVAAGEIDLIIVATSTPDYVFPSTACLLQAKLGVAGGAAFDVQAVCSGFVYAIATADTFIRSGQYKKALVVGAEVFSRILDWNDRGTCVLFGDGAGAVVLEVAPGPGLMSARLHADGAMASILCTAGRVENGAVFGDPFLRMDGQAVFKVAVNVLDSSAREVLADADLAPAAVDWLIPHQANVRILSATARKLGIAQERVIVTVDQHGNTSAASVPLALDWGVRNGRIKRDQILLLQGVGGGFTWGSVLLRL